MASQEHKRGGAAKPSPLSPKRLGQARKSYYTFNFLNSFSFVFLSGSFVTLFAIRMGASNALVGILNAIAYTTFFMMPIGKKVVRKKPIVWTFGWAWVGRYAALLPVLLAPQHDLGEAPVPGRERDAASFTLRQAQVGRASGLFDAGKQGAATAFATAEATGPLAGLVMAARTLAREMPNRRCTAGER